MQILQKHPKFKWLIALGDLVAAGLSLVTTFALTGGEDPGELPAVFLVIVTTIISVCHVLVFQLLDLYKLQIIVSQKLKLIQIAKGIIFFGLVASGVHLLARVGSPVMAALYATILLVYVLAIRHITLYLLTHTEIISDRIVIVGAGSKAKSMHASFSSRLGTHKIIGFVDDNVSNGTVINDVEVLGDIYQSHTIAERLRIDYFVMAIDNVSREDFHRILYYFTSHKLTVYICSSYLNILQQKVSTDIFHQYKLIRIGNASPSPALRFSKRIFDVLVSIVLIVLLAPFLLILAIIIFCSSKGPVIFRQTRIGKMGKPFTFYKFRSMKINSDRDIVRNAHVVDFIKGNNSDGTNTKIVNKSRITGIGRFMRRTSLDELPQLFNVLRGDMSLVGPRPCLPVEWTAYEEWQKQRLTTIPGCTGIWQTKGRSTVNFEQTVLLDIYYNCNISLWLDLKIMVNTIPVMVFSKGGE